MTTIMIRNGTTSEWTAKNPVLAEGEPGVDLTTGELKFGDGVTPWANLKPIRPDGRFDIRDYGAKTTLTDNRSAFAAAFAAASAAGGGVVWVPVGTWNVVATTGRSLSLPANVTLEGADRKRSIVRVHETSGDWGNLFCYPSTGGCDNAIVRRLTIDGSTNTNPAGTAMDFFTARCVLNLIGKNVIVEDCDIKGNGVWLIHHAGDNVRIRNCDFTTDLSAYTLGFFDVSAVWFFSQNGRCEGNTFTTVEPATNTFVVQTNIEFQGHRNTVSGNKHAPGSRSRNGMLVTASTYYAGLTNFYPASPKGANDNIIEGNEFTCTRYGVEIWGMVVTSNLPISGLRIRSNEFYIDNSAGAVAAACGVNVYIGTTGAGGNDGPQTGSIVDLVVEGNSITYASRRVSTSYFTGDAGVRLVTEIPITDVLVINNCITNCGGFGVLANVDAAYSVSIEHVEVVGNNRFVDVREPVRFVRNVNNYHEGRNVFRQTTTYGTVNDNMIECVAHRPGDWSSETGGIIEGNSVIRTQTGHKAYYPQRDHGVSQAYAPAARGYVVADMPSNVKIQIPGVPITLGTGQVARRYSDGVLVKPSLTVGATLSTTSLQTAAAGNVTIASVIDSSNMTVNDATNIYPGMVLALNQVVFVSPAVLVLAVVGTTVKVTSNTNNNLAFQSGKSNADAVGQVLSYYGTVVTA